MFYLLTRHKFVGVRVSKGDALGPPLELTCTRFHPAPSEVCHDSSNVRPTSVIVSFHHPSSGLFTIRHHNQRPLSASSNSDERGDGGSKAAPRKETPAARRWSCRWARHLAFFVQHHAACFTWSFHWTARSACVAMMSPPLQVLFCSLFDVSPRCLRASFHHDSAETAVGRLFGCS
jgi:hypothetical protein